VCAPLADGFKGHNDTPFREDFFDIAQAQGKSVVKPGTLYGRLGENPVKRRQAYRALFAHELGEEVLEHILVAMNKAWVLGDQRFRDQIQAQLRRRVAPKTKGGDRRSKHYRV